MARTFPAKPGVPRDKWLPPKLWDKISQTMPIPCVDIIFQRPNNSILYGWRLIPPYKGIWALVAGRIPRGENLPQCASRIAKEYGLGFGRLYLTGVFPVSFPKRSDIVVSFAARNVSGEPRVDEVEFSNFAWSIKLPERLGANYLRMVAKWSRVVESKDFLCLTRLL